MQWTTERTTWLGTYRERRGRWHGVPYLISAPSPSGLSRRGWAVVVAALLLFAVVVVVEELLV